MRLRGWIERLTRRVPEAQPAAGPLTVFLVEATAECLPGMRVVWGGVAREVCYDPALGPPPLPPGGPHKLIPGPCSTCDVNGARPTRSRLPLKVAPPIANRCIYRTSSRDARISRRLDLGSE